MKIDKEKDVDTTPKRAKLDSISYIDRYKRYREMDLLQAKLLGALRIYVENNPQERDRFKKMQNGIDGISNIYADSLLETSYVLGVKDIKMELEGFNRGNLEVPPGVVHLAYMRRDEKGGHIVGINAYEFYKQAKKWATHSPVIRKEVQKEIRSSMAEEIAHIYVALRYPQTDFRSEKANKESWDKYQEDRGEKFAGTFAERYLEYSNLT